jgi:hypothetical protein
MAHLDDVCEVEAYSGARYGESPRAFVCRGVRFDIAAVERAWRAPDGPRFLVRTTGGERYLLSYQETTGIWTSARRE